MVLGPRVRGWVPVRTVEVWRRVEGSLLVGGGAGLEDEGWRAVCVGRVDIMDGVLPPNMVPRSEGGEASDGRAMNYLLKTSFAHLYPLKMTCTKATMDGECQMTSHSEAQYEL